MFVVLLTLFHVLVLVYWLGGDLGAFYTSSFMTDPKRSVAERMMAVKILNNIDMAPRTMLILAFPTGLALASAKGWIDLPAYIPAIVALLFLGWLALAWAVHLRHGDGGAVKKIDLAIRYVCVATFGLSGVAGLVGLLTIPLFIALKLCLLAGCVALGLVVRRQLVPLFGAIREMTTSGPTAGTDAIIRRVNEQARVSVITIWLLITLAAYLGIATPN